MKENITLVPYISAGDRMGVRGRHLERISRIIATNIGGIPAAEVEAVPRSLWAGLQHARFGAWLILKKNAAASQRSGATRKPLPPEVREMLLKLYGHPSTARCSSSVTIPLSDRETRAGYRGHRAVTQVRGTPTPLPATSCSIGTSSSNAATFPQAETHMWPDCGTTVCSKTQPTRLSRGCGISWRSTRSQ
ncbi:MAG: hypothetical protein U0792_07170 [Gemmataceae bacterium]